MLIQKHEPYMCIVTANSVIVKKAMHLTPRKLIDKCEQMRINRAVVSDGSLSVNSIRRIKKICDVWSSGIKAYNDKMKFKTERNKVKMVFITLTLSSVQKHTDIEIKRILLNKFLILAKREFGMHRYLWRAEKQKNGNIHFHLITDIYINMHSLQALWNKVQRLSGYLDEYFLNYGNYAAPSTHIELVKDNEGMLSYLVKYVTKTRHSVDSEMVSLSGRQWGCSDNLKLLRPFRVELDEFFISKMFELERDLSVKKFETEYFVMYSGNIFEAFKLIDSSGLYIISNYFSNIYINLLQFSYGAPALAPNLKNIITDIPLIVPEYVQLSLFENFLPDISLHFYN